MRTVHRNFGMTRVEWVLCLLFGYPFFCRTNRTTGIRKICRNVMTNSLAGNYGHAFPLQDSCREKSCRVPGQLGSTFDETETSSTFLINIVGRLTYLAILLNCDWSTASIRMFCIRLFLRTSQWISPDAKS